MIIFTWLLISSVAAPVAKRVVEGEATVINAYTLEISGERILLAGVDAPDLRQYCLVDGDSPYACGREATDELLAIAQAKVVRCVIEQGRGRCVQNDTDVARQMVEKGYAFATEDPVGSRYVPFQTLAKKSARGMWRGSFEPPKAWRERMAEAKIIAHR